MMIRKKKRK